MGQHTSPTVAVRDLPRTARRLLRTVLAWYNGTPVDDRHIATHRPPKYTPYHQRAVDVLRGQDLTRSERVLGTQIEWALTPQGRQLVDGLDDTPLVGDYGESLRHRTGVAITAHWLRHHREDVPADSVVEYPGQPGDRRCDLRARSRDGHTLGVEVLTDHNDVDLYRRKLEYVRSADSPDTVALVFPSRRVATTVLNRIHRSDQTTVSIPNFPLEEPGQWALDVVSRYVRQGRARDGPHDTTGLPARLYSYYALFQQIGAE